MINLIEILKVFEYLKDFAVISDQNWAWSKERDLKSMEV